MGSFLAIRQPDRRKISVAVLVSAFLVTLGSAPVSAEGSEAPGDRPAAASGIIDLTPLMELPPAERAVQLQGVGSWFIDESGALSLRDVMNRDFDETPMLDFGIIDAAVWSRFRLESEEDSSWILFCRSHKVDRFDFHAVYPDGRIETSSAGTEIPLSDRTYRYHRPVFSFTASAGEPVDIYARVRTRSSLYRDFTVSSDSFFLSYILRDERFLFFYFGAIIVIALYNLVIFFITRDRNYLYYFLYVFFMLMYQVSVEGYGNIYLWPGCHWFMPRSYNIFIAAAFVVGVMFTRSYLDLPGNAPRLDAAGRILIVIFTAVGIGFLFTTAGWLVNAGTVCILAGVLYILASAYSVLYRRFQPAAYFAVSWTALIAGIVITTATRIHWISHSLFSEYALHIGNLVEVVLLALALGDRVRFIQKKRIEAEESLTDANGQVLQNRMKPHFLFNSMNLIFSQLEESPEQAQKTLRLLSDNYHYLTTTDGKTLVTLSEEWGFLMNYLELMKRRWPGAVDVRCRFDESLSHLPVPPVILQPLAENAFKYGLRELGQKELEVSCSVDAGFVSLRVANLTELPLGQVTYARTLGNIRARLRRYYRDADLILRQEGRYVISEIRFPFPGSADSEGGSGGDGRGRGAGRSGRADDDENPGGCREGSKGGVEKRKPRGKSAPRKGARGR